MDKSNELETAVHWLVNSLNQYADNGVNEIKKSVLSLHLSCGYISIDTGLRKKCEMSWDDIQSKINEWETKGWVKQVADISKSEDDDVCLILLRYIGGGVWEEGGELPS